MADKTRNELPRSFRFSAETNALLDALSEATNLDRKEILEMALRHWVPEGARIAAQRRGKLDSVLTSLAGEHTAKVKQLLGGKNEMRSPVS
jgi:predicted transcriptional regulator